jgi:hypothetical protein
MAISSCRRRHKTVKSAHFWVAQALKTLTQQDYLAMREGAVVLEQTALATRCSPEPTAACSSCSGASGC